MQPNQPAQVVLTALNQILNRLSVFADGLIMARKLVDRLEAENLELRKERDDLLRIDNERLVSVAVADTEEKQ